MQTFPIESPTTDLSKLAHLAAKGQEVLLTENDRPLAKIVPLSKSDDYRERIRALRGAAKGLDTSVQRDEDRV